MKEYKKQCSILMSAFLVLLLTFSSVLAVEPAGVNFNEEGSENIVIEDLGFFETLFGTFSIYTDEGTYEPGDTAEFIVQTTSWNLHCTNSWIVVELYDQNGDFVEPDSLSLGTIKGNTDVNKRVSIDLSSRAESGTWTAVEYLWCTGDDTSYDGVDHTNQVISSSTKVSFQVDNPAEACDYTSTGYQSQYSCSGDRVQRLYVTSTSTCSAQWRDYETCDFGCSGGECIDAECNQNSDCSSGFACDAGSCTYIGTSTDSSSGSGSGSGGDSSSSGATEESYEETSSGGFPLEAWQIAVLVALVIIGLGMFFVWRK